jgi:hypothetical protein
MKLADMTLREVGKKLIIPFVFFVVAAIMTPPDVISQLVFFVEMLIIYGVLRFIVSRFESYPQTPESIKKLIIVLLCLLTITMISSFYFFQCYCSSRKSYDKLEAEHSNRPTSPQQTLTQ